MRYHALLCALALAAVMSACVDDGHSPLPTQPATVNASISPSDLSCDVTIIRGLITQLYPSPSVKNTREALLNKFSQGMEFMPNKQLQAWKKFVDIMRKVDDDFDAGRLPVLSSPTTAERRADLFARLFSCAGYTPPEFPTGGDNIVGIIDDPTVSRTFISTGGDFAVQTPPGMFSQPVVIIGSKKSDGFAVQDIYDEFPIKTEITVNPSGKEVPGKKSIVKICQYEDDFEDDGANRGFMRIAQRHDEGSGEGTIQVVKVLQFTTGGPFLVCPNSPPSDLTSGAGYFSHSLATAGRVLSGAQSLILSTFAPRPLYAVTSMVDGGVGGFVDQFFSFYAGVEVPDLTIPNITVIPAAPTTSSSLSFDVEIDNVGRGSSPPSSLHWTIATAAAPTTILLSGNFAVDEIDGFVPGEGEGSGPGVANALVEVENSLSAGNYIFSATADFPNTVAELNETAATPFANNVGTKTFTMTTGPIIEIAGRGPTAATAGRSGSATGAVRTRVTSTRRSPTTR